MSKKRFCFGNDHRSILEPDTLVVVELPIRAVAVYLLATAKLPESSLRIFRSSFFSIVETKTDNWDMTEQHFKSVRWASPANLYKSNNKRNECRKCNFEIPPLASLHTEDEFMSTWEQSGCFCNIWVT